MQGQLQPGANQKVSVRRKACTTGIPTSCSLRASNTAAPVLREALGSTPQTTAIPCAATSLRRALLPRGKDTHTAWPPMA